MEKLSDIGHYLPLADYGMMAGIIVLGTWGLYRLVRWARRRPKGALLFMALMPLLSFIPIPPMVIRNIERAKQEQRKRKEDSGDPPLSHGGDRSDP
ncbi:MAG: hypothetical protein QGG61_08470 [Arenicellales bacterium]|jgi:hypothetical protein|nr:hypothetical protein [Arenicellales bacterium]MDP7284402.1 hypothetical protein [Arenicellales bacterium]|tara:strand:- start:2082 stop:2369 length:288 start_codon:yes stop_codon:yes gene_type:complete